MWKNIQINKNQIQKELDRAILINCPKNSEYKGYSFWHPSKLIRYGNHKACISVLYEEGFEFILKKYGNGRYNKKIVIDEKKITFKEFEEMFKLTDETNKQNQSFETHKPKIIKGVDEMYNNKKIKIKILSNCEEIIFQTDSENFEKDFAKLESLKCWWRVCIQYEYEDGERLAFDKPHNINGISPRSIVFYNGRSIYSNYNLNTEIGEHDFKNEIYEALIEDFRTTKELIKTHQSEKEYKDYIKEISSPKNKNIPPVNNIIEELKDV